MTDCSLVKQELKATLNYDDEMLDKYDSLISYAVSCIASLLKNEEEADDIKLVHLCAVRANYNIELINKDDIVSFKAGDVSYTKDASSFDKARKMYDEALADCKAMLKTDFSGFAFEVM